MATAFPDVKPFPKTAPPAAGSQPGHNRPPIEVEARAAFDAVLDGKEGFRQRVTDLIAASSRAVATDEDSAGRCGELVKQIRAAKKFIEDAHAQTKAPYLAAGRAIDAAKNELTPGLEAAQRTVEGKQTTFLRDQQARREAEARRAREAEEARRREEVERLAAERSADAPDETPPPPPVAVEPERHIIRGDFGAAVSGQKVWYSQVEDYEIAFIHVANNEKVREAIDKAVAAAVRAGEREIPGVRIWSDVKASNR